MNIRYFIKVFHNGNNNSSQICLDKYYKDNIKSSSIGFMMGKKFLLERTF